MHEAQLVESCNESAMTMRYFELFDDVDIAGRWELDDPVDSKGREIEGSWRFTEGRPVRLHERLEIPICEQGKPLDFSLAGFGVPIVSGRVASIFAELAPEDVQLILVDIEGQTEPFFMLVCTRVETCIDDERSGAVRYWRPEDGRPELVGQYSFVYKVKIDAERAGTARVFRPGGWPVVLIVAEPIKDALQRMGATGVKFEEV